MVAAPREGLLRRTVTAGLVAGVVLVYLSMVGLVEAFSHRQAVTGIGAEAGPGLLTLGRVMIGGAVFLGGLILSGRLSQLAAPSAVGRLMVVGGAALSGLIAGSVLALFVLVVSVIDVRGVFLSVTPALLDYLTFDQGPALGALIILMSLGIISALAGGIRLLGLQDRGAVLKALTAALLISLLEPLLRPILGQLELADVNRFLYAGGGLTQPAAAVILGGVAAASWAWARPAAPLRQRVRDLPGEQRRMIGIGAALAAFIGLLILPQISTGFVSLVLVNVGFFLLLALGLNIVVGYAGLLDLGYVAFYAVGAYTVAVLISPSSSAGGPITELVGTAWAFWVALPIVMITAALVGIFIGAPVLRLRGDYLAIVTLGFGEIARILFGSDALRPWVGGPGGVIGLPNLQLPVVGFQFTSPSQYIYPVIAFSALAAFVAWRLANSRTGRAWNAIREDESVAAATGVNITNYKLLAFALGGTLGGLAGALFAVQLRSVYPGTFNIIVSFTVLAIIILGGMGTIRGVMVGALILVGLPEALREFGEYRFLLYGAALVAMMLLRPEGLFPSRIRRAELHEELPPEEQEQLPKSGGGGLAVSAGPISTYGPGSQPGG
jgi:branched-chain amino acid transport system permease protein